MLDIFGALFIGSYLAVLVVILIRAALARVDLQLLIGLHAFRVGGTFFLLLELTHRLAPAFAWTAGLGDIVVGAFAVVLVLRPRSASSRAIRAWNALGALDLVLAVTTALLSVPSSPIGIFAVEPGMRTMMTMPWVLVPTALVPLLLLTHLVIAARVRSPESHETFTLSASVGSRSNSL
jgi:hypothetical protein